jgi:hypothetical protein
VTITVSSTDSVDADPSNNSIPVPISD